MLDDLHKTLGDLPMRISDAPAVSSFDDDTIDGSDITGFEIKKTQINYNLPGPVATEYFLSRHFISFIMGPVGSGKTTASFLKLPFEAQRMPPITAEFTKNPKEIGWRKYKILIIRDGYDGLWEGTIPSYLSIFPKDMVGSEWTGANRRPASHKVRWEDSFGPIEMEVHFRAFTDGFDPNLMRGLQQTDIMINEADIASEQLLSWSSGRVGRYPNPALIKNRGGRVFGDTNAPEPNPENYFYRDFIFKPKTGYKLFRQPGGRETGAENIDIMGRDYYQRQVIANSHRPGYIARMIDNIPAYDTDEELVYVDFKHKNHVSDDLKPLNDVPLIVGLDAGLTPAAAIIQELPTGQIRVLGELCTKNTGAKDFAEQLTLYIYQKFPKHTMNNIYFVCDPAAKAGEDANEASWRQRVAKALGQKVHLAQSNLIHDRIEPIKEILRITLDGDTPLLCVSSGCHQIIHGFLVDYKYNKHSKTGEIGQITKTFSSHIHDALQYAVMATGRAKQLFFRQRNEKMNKNKMNHTKNQRYNPLARYGL